MPTDIFSIKVEGLADAKSYGDALAKLSKIQQQLGATTRNLGNDLKEILKFKGLDADGNRVTTTLTRMNGQLVNSVTSIDSTTKAITKLTKETNNAEKSFRRFGLIKGVVIGSLISRGVAELTNAMRDGIDESSKFLVKIGELQTISQQQPQTLDQWINANAQLASSFNKDLLETVAGSYQVLSNQIAEGSDVTKFMAEASRLSTIALGSQEDAVNALSSVINSYGLSNTEARKQADALFKAVDLGRFTLKDIGNTLGSVTILANQLGVSVEEVYTALVILTKQGVEADNAMTFLRQVFNEMLKPSKAMTAALNEMGASTAQEVLAANGLGGTLEKFQKIARASGSEANAMARIFNELRGNIGATGILFGNFEKTLNQVKNGTDEANEAFRIMQDNIGIKFQKQFNDLRIFFTTEIGVNFIKNVVKFTDATVDAVDAVRAIFVLATIAAEAYAAALVVRVVSATGAAIAQTSLYNTILALNQGGLLAAAAASGTYAGALTGLAAKIKGFLPFLGFAVGFEFGRRFFAVADDIRFTNRTLTADFIEASTKRDEAFRKEMDNLTKNSEAALEKTGKSFKQLELNLTGVVNKTIALAETQRDILHAATEREIDLLTESGDTAAARSLAMKEFNNIKKQLEEFATKGISEETSKEVKKLFSEADQLISKIDSIDDAAEKFNEKISRANDKFLDSMFKIPGATDKASKAQQQFAKNVDRLSDSYKRAKASKDALLSTQAIKVEEEGFLKQKLPGRGKGITQTTRFVEEIFEERQATATSDVLNLKRQLLDIEKRMASAVSKQDLSPILREKENLFSTINLLKQLNKEYDQLLAKIQSNKKEANENQAQVAKFFEEVSKFGQGLAENTRGINNLGKGGIFSKSFIPDRDQFKADIKTLSEAAKLETTAANVDNIAAAFNRLKESTKDLQGANFIDRLVLGLSKGTQQTLPADIAALGQKAQAMLTLAQNIERLQIANKAIEEQVGPIMKSVAEKVAQLIRDFDATNPQFQQFISNSKNSLTEIGTALSQAVTQVGQELARVRAIIAEAEVKAGLVPPLKGPGSFFGRFITRATGGSVGKDSVLGMFDPREFIMNSRAASKFLPQLIAMNSNRHFDTGGPTNTTNVGDVNVNITGADTQQINARSLGIAIRRELRRNTLRLN